ncbi:hypothetical protein AABB24_003680 [Solanum stoloniferum]|uniref:Uncharacterized protein n=1 Tax=Solanum stoloniferum TaxID=62892 RepID=A0ABD2VB86_9SOLN
MVTSWILNSLSKEISDIVEYVNNSIELWKELEDRYDQTNGAKLYQIQKKIDDLTQCVLDIIVYYTKMKKLWEELSTLNTKSLCTCICTCGAKDNMYKAEQDRRLIQFLMGLNEVYIVIRGNILMMNPLPSIAQAFSLLIHKEKQREFRPASRMPMDSTSLNVNFVNTGRGSIDRSYRTNFSNSNSGNNNNYERNGSYSGNDNNKNVIVCEYCKKQGHTKEKYYKLHGYPPGNNILNYKLNNGQSRQTNHQNFKGKKIVANVHSTSVDTHGEECSQGNNNPNSVITQEQYDQIMNLLQQFQLDSPREDFKVNANSGNFAGL